MTKAYVVLYDNNNFYYPVKASTSPYNGGATYCGGSPQFFGGKVDYGETNLGALRRETAEESALTYVLSNSALLQVMETTTGDEPYYFYMSNRWQKPAEHSWPASSAAWNAYPPEFREMCCIVSVSINSCITALGLTKGQEPTQAPWQLSTLPQLAETLVNAAVSGAPAWAKTMVETVPSSEFLASETLVAFAAATYNCL